MFIRKSLIFIIIIYSLMLVGCSNIEKDETPKAEKGILNLENWNFEENGILELNGTWEFYDKQLLEPEDFYTQGVNINYTNVNNNSNHFEYDGYATYRLKILLNNKNDILALNIKNDYFQDYKLWIDDKMVSSDGDISPLEFEKETRRNMFKSNYITFAPLNNEVYLTLQVSSSKVKNFDAITLGTNQQMAINIQKKIIEIFALIAMLLSIGLYHLATYTLNKKAVYNLYFFMICFCLFSVLVVNQLRSGDLYFYLTNQFELFLINNFGHYTLAGLSAILANISSMFFILFMNSFFEPKAISQKKSRGFVKISIVSIIIFVVCSAINFYDFGYYFIYLVNLSFFVNACVSMYILIVSIKKKIPEAIIAGIGFFIFIIFGVNEVLTHAQILNTKAVLSAGIVFLIFFKAFSISYKFTKIFKNTERFSEKLKNTLSTLKELINKSKNISLSTDKRVRELADMIENMTMSNKEVMIAISEVAKGAEIQTKKTNSSLEAGDILSKNSQNIKNNANTMKESAIELINMSDKGGMFIKNLIEMQEKSQMYMEDVIEVVDELAKKINEISSFSESIKVISKETKLLAFNALVEASKSDNEVKGFNVIAQNIKKLAEQSDLKAKEIQGIIINIINTSLLTVEKLNTSKEATIKQNEVVLQTANIFKLFKDSVSNSINEINKVYNSIDELIEIRDVVINSMGEISVVTDNNSAITEEVLAKIEEQTNQIYEINVSTKELKKEYENMQNHISKLNID